MATTPSGLEEPIATPHDAWLFGWDPTPGIVSVWAEPGGRTLVWQRCSGRVRCSSDRYRPWLLAATLADLAHLGSTLLPDDGSGDATCITYRQLDGPRGSLRYLLSAPDWRLLEQALLEGASRRLSQPVTTLYDLAEYYRVGFVEQYLMQTGRVYFRGLSYADIQRMQVDLETTSLDPRHGRIFLIAVRDSSGLATTLEAAEPADEPRLIRELCALIEERDPDVIENHNLYGFDLPFLEYRAALHGIPLRLGRKEGPATPQRSQDLIDWRGRRRQSYHLAGRELVDTLEAVRRYDFSARELPSYRLKDVARYFGIAPQDRVYLSGAEIYQTFRREPASVRQYALNDVEEVDGLSQRLLGAPFALARMAPRRYSRLVSAGPAMGILEPMLVRAYLQAGAALPPHADGDGSLAGHAGGAVYLFASGIAQHVVKADIASMYPSLMRAYQIGPTSDRLGVLLHLVGRLTDLRLRHKEAARQAAADSLESSHQTALQLAMKILINSAYGYLGAGRMALFGDRLAADEVTRRGRQVLEHVVQALRERGMELLEADTDGVYFAVPASWTEDRERALVAEIGASLPQGLNLEYEGRYRAMFSYEVKNYALLTYDGKLIIRGAALRSSRAEPFGVRFLAEALRAAMQGDIAGLQRIFRETVAALRSRSLPAADVATRVRLTKTPEEYLRKRASHREGAYEALLAAGRKHWQPGERIRFYKASSNRYVWLPDEDETGPATNSQAAPNQEQQQGTGRSEAAGTTAAMDRTGGEPRDYDVEHYVQVLSNSFTARLRKAFAPEDFAQIFRLDTQLGLFDQPVEHIQPRWIRCRESA